MKTLTTEQAAEIVAQQQVLLEIMKGTLKEYPDFFFIAVHKSNEVIFSGTQGDPQRISEWLAGVMANNPAFLEFFKGCVKLAETTKK